MAAAVTLHPWGCAVPRYFFDVHSAGAAVWDSDGEVIQDRTEIERRARELIAEHAQDQADPGSISISVHREDDGIILTAVASPRDGIRLAWGGDGA